MPIGLRWGQRPYKSPPTPKSDLKINQYKSLTREGREDRFPHNQQQGGDECRCDRCARETDDDLLSKLRR